MSRVEVVNAVADKLKQKCPIFQNGVVYIEELNSIVDLVTVCDLLEGKRVSFWQSQLCIHAFRLSDQGPESDFLDGEEELSAAEQWELPNSLLVGLWDSIVIDTVIKNRLLSYCSSSIQFSDARIDSNIISWNRMVLLHGPPGNCLAVHSIIVLSHDQCYFRYRKDHHLQSPCSEDVHPQL